MTNVSEKLLLYSNDLLLVELVGFVEKIEPTN